MCLIHTGLASVAQSVERPAFNRVVVDSISTEGDRFLSSVVERWPLEPLVVCSNHTGNQKNT